MMKKPTKSGYGNSVYSFYMRKKNRILPSIKGCNSGTNLLKMTLYNHNVNVYTKFGLILFILSQDIEQKEILTSIKGRNSVANLRKNEALQSQHRSHQ